MVILFGVVGEASARHTLAQAAFIEEIALQVLELAVEQEMVTLIRHTPFGRACGISCL